MKTDINQHLDFSDDDIADDDGINILELAVRTAEAGVKGGFSMSVDLIGDAVLSIADKYNEWLVNRYYKGRPKPGDDENEIG